MNIAHRFGEIEKVQNEQLLSQKFSQYNGRIAPTGDINNISITKQFFFLVSLSLFFIIVRILGSTHTVLP